jgi:hypothetical protein
VRRLAIILCFCLAAAATRWLRLDAFADHQRAEHYEDVYYLPPAHWLPVMSLGYTSALADLLWCRTLVYFGEEIGVRGSVRHLFNYTDAVLALDPDFRAAYRWASTGILYRPVAATLEEGLQGAEYLRRAVARWPNDGELRWEFGSYLRFELAPMLKKDPSAKDRVLAESATHLHVAALKGAGPPWLALNNSTLLNRLGQKEQAIHQLEEVYATVNDDETRTAIRERIASLRSETYAAALGVAIEQFDRERATNFPYMEEDLFLLVGLKVSPGYARAVADHFGPAREAGTTGGDEAAP